MGYLDLTGELARRPRLVLAGELIGSNWRTSPCFYQCPPRIFIGGLSCLTLLLFPAIIFQCYVRIQARSILQHRLSSILWARSLLGSLIRRPFVLEREQTDDVLGSLGETNGHARALLTVPRKHAVTTVTRALRGPHVVRLAGEGFTLHLDLQLSPPSR